MLRNRKGFTLVELLVVITIISMLISMLLPAVQASRESGRRAQCLNNQKQFTLALMNYESQRRAFPGWVNMLPGGTPGTSTSPWAEASWVVTILPQLERTDLYDRWIDPVYGCKSSGTTYVQPADITQLTGLLRFGYCPSDIPDDLSPTATPLAYVINCGNDDYPFGYHGTYTHKNDRNCGVAFDRSGRNFANGSAQWTETSLDFISGHDGSVNTLLLSENVRNDTNRIWAPANPRGATATNAASSTHLSYVGMMWASGVATNDLLYWTPSTTGTLEVCKINRDLRTHRARPSSLHPGGVVASFCDGHSQFIREDMDYLVYQHLMTPDGKAAGTNLAKGGVPGGSNGLPAYDTTPGATPNLANSIFSSEL